MRPSWNDDHPDDLELIGLNSRDALRAAIGHARRREPPTSELACRWHATTFEGCRIPVDYYAGNYRDSDTDRPHLDGYRVAVGATEGTNPHDVPAAVERFVAALDAVVARLDPVIESGGAPSTVEQLEGVLRLAAVAHGEWVRIHPFANGNGRTARLWANWVLARYGLRPAVRVKPRPISTRYAAATQSMRGNHEPMIDVIRAMLEDM